MAGINGRKQAPWAKFFQDLGSTVPSPGSAEFDEAGMQQRLHALPVAASFILMELCLQASELLQQLIAIAIDTVHLGSNPIFHFPYTVLPPTTVRSTSVPRISAAGIRVMSRSSATKSANIPGSSLPLSRSANSA